MNFKDAWAKKEADGYQYGKSEQQIVEFGWGIAEEEYTPILKELVGVLDEFFCNRRTRFIPSMHLSPEAYELYTKLAPKK